MTTETFAIFAPTFDRDIKLSSRVSVELFSIKSDDMSAVAVEASNNGWTDYAFVKLYYGNIRDGAFNILMRLQHSYTDDEVGFIVPESFTAWAVLALQEYLNERSLATVTIIAVRADGKLLTDFTAPEPEGVLQVADTLSEEEVQRAMHLFVSFEDPLADAKIDEFRLEFHSLREQNRRRAAQNEATRGRISAESTFPLFVGEDVEVALFIGAQVQNEVPYDGYLETLNRVSPNAVGQTTKTYFAVVKGEINEDNLGGLRIAAQDYVDNYLLPGTTLVNVTMEQGQQASVYHQQTFVAPTADATLHSDLPFEAEPAAQPERTPAEIIAAEEAAGVYRVSPTTQE